MRFGLPSHTHFYSLQGMAFLALVWIELFGILILSFLWTEYIRYSLFLFVTTLWSLFSHLTPVRAGGCCPWAAAWSGGESSRHKHLGDGSRGPWTPGRSRISWWCCCCPSPGPPCHTAAAHWEPCSDWLSLSCEASDWSVEVPQGWLASHGDGCPAPEPTLDIISFYRKEWNQPGGNSFQCIFVHI